MSIHKLSSVKLKNSMIYMVQFENGVNTFKPGDRIKGNVVIYLDKPQYYKGEQLIMNLRCLVFVSLIRKMIS
jgi:hypothetical protein